MTTSFQSWAEVQLQDAEQDALASDLLHRAVQVQARIDALLEAAKSQPMTPELRCVLDTLAFGQERLASVLSGEEL